MRKEETKGMTWGDCDSCRFYDWWDRNKTFVGESDYDIFCIKKNRKPNGHETSEGCMFWEKREA